MPHERYYCIQWITNTNIKLSKYFSLPKAITVVFHISNGTELSNRFFLTKTKIGELCSVTTSFLIKVKRVCRKLSSMSTRNLSANSETSKTTTLSNGNTPFTKHIFRMFFFGLYENSFPTFDTAKKCLMFKRCVS